MTTPIFRSLLFMGVFALATAILHADEQDTITKTFTSKPGARLTMKVDRGSIDIQTHQADTVEVTIVRDLKRVSSEKAQEIFQQHKIDLAQTDDGVTIKAEMPRKGAANWLGAASRLRVSYTIVVPEKYDLELATAGGDIRVANLEGDVNCRTSGGDLRFGSIKGPIQGRTSGGSIRLESTTGDADVHTSGGDIRLGSVAGKVIAKTSGGSIEIDQANGEVRAETSGGDIRVKDSKGPVVAQTSGGSVLANLAQSPTGDCSFKTSGGSVKVTLPENAAITLAARTSGGTVGSDFPGEFNKGHNRYNATLNGGGPEMVLETSGGSIQVRKR